MKALFIINPLAGKKTGKNISGLIDKYLDTERIEPTILYSDYPGHARVLAGENAGNYDLMVAGGGDGTINEVSQSLVHTDTILGILPMGSGRGLARTLGIPVDMADAIRTLNELNIVSIDAGKAGDQFFFSIAGIGFASEVAHTYADSKRRGFFSYSLNIVRRLPGYSPVEISVTIDERTISGKYFDISMANSTQWGYGAHISPLSRPDDGWLEICLLSSFPKILAPCLIARLFLKTIHQSRYMQIIPGRTIHMEGKGSCTGHLDGEPVEFTLPMNIEVFPGSLKVITPAKKFNVRT